MTETAHRVAVVDDDRSIRIALSSLLRSVGYEVLLFESAAEFLQLAQMDMVGCVLSDVHMPGMSGLQLLESLNLSGSATPVILLTAFPEPGVRQRAMELGAYSFLGKPFEADVILGHVEKAIGMS